MAAQMVARGPDCGGEWLSDDGRVALGHRRLAIIDLDPRAAQPMQDGLYVLAYNGEIYNYRELRAQLESEGVSFRTTSDTEVLLKLYIRHGEGMLERLRGMFAFALWDGRERRMLLARDPYGIKPLYYADDGRAVRVASQVRALLASKAVPREKNNAGIAGFFLFGSLPEPHTAFRAVRSLPSGSRIWVDSDGVGEPKRYFDLTKVFADAASEAPPIRHVARKQTIRQALLDSVRHHLVADVPIATFLSAGIDSTALVALMRDLGQDEIETITLAFEEYRGTSWDESVIAEQTAKRYGTRHHTRVVSAAEFHSVAPTILDAMDQPSIDGINTWFVSRAVHERGLKVALSGVGGDELFGGYASTFDQVPRWVRMLRGPSRSKAASHAWRAAWARAAPWLEDRLSPKLGGLLKYGGSYPGAYFLRRGLFMPWELDAVMTRDAAVDALETLDPISYLEGLLRPEPRTDYARIAALEGGMYLRNQLLRDSDWASMAHSVELRTPLVDASLLRQLAPLLAPGQEVVSKNLLAEAPSTRLDDLVAKRQKTGFAIPVQQWLLADGGSEELDAWREVPLLRRRHCHWARRFAYVVMRRLHTRG